MLKFFRSLSVFRFSKISMLLALTLFGFLSTRNTISSVNAQQEHLHTQSLVEQSDPNFPYQVGVAWSPDGKLLAAGTVKGIWVYNKNFEPVAYFKGDNEDNYYRAYLSWSGDGTKIVSTDKNAYVWNAKTGKRLLEYPLPPSGGSFTSVAMCPTGKMVAIGDVNRTVWLWDATTGKDIATLTDNAYGAAFYLDWDKTCSYLIVGIDTGSQYNKIWSVKPQKLLSSFGYRLEEYSSAVSPNRKWLATGYAYYDWDGEAVGIWDINSGKQLFVLEEHKATVVAVTWSPDSRRLASLDSDGTLIIWDIPSQQVLAKLQGGSDMNFQSWSYANALSWSPDGNMLVTGTMDNIVRIYDMRTYKLITTLTADGSF